uniref:Uncharacterized protein n=1 Tax=Phytophthora fragariae TaxID=53985 RepID=A0A6A3DKU9_9STRA|nr:hypothetical protein PF009_g27767 [Phytophthora fragariae]
MRLKVSISSHCVDASLFCSFDIPSPQTFIKRQLLLFAFFNSPSSKFTCLVRKEILLSGFVKRDALTLTSSDEEEKDEENVRDNLNHESCNDQLLRDATGGTQLRFNYVDPLDPNNTGDTGDTALDTDGEGEEESAEAFIGTINDADSELSDAGSSDGDILQRELSRVTKVMDAADLERLHMQIQASSEVFDDDQLYQMKVDGWEVLPENVEAEIVDDPSVDKIDRKGCTKLFMTCCVKTAHCLRGIALVGVVVVLIIISICFIRQVFFFF